ncbi:tyrosine-protein phosphatase [Paenibacillus sp. strain BS8-2]
MTMSTENHIRLLKLDGACNVRDIGGYEAGEGLTIQKGRFLRADGLHRLTESDQDTIIASGVTMIIDLRHAMELAAKRNVFESSERASYYNISLINPATTTRVNIRSLGDMYVNMLDECGPLLQEVFALISQAEGSVLFHCTAGKDRTGVVAALLLDLAGVERSVIVADYAETEINLAPIMHELRGDRPEQVPAETYELFLGSAPSNMEQMLDHLHAKFGGAESYLAHIGLSAEAVTSIKRKLLHA